MDIQKDIVTWLKTLKGWQTELAYRILTKQIVSSDIADILSMLKNNTPFVDKAFPNFVNAAGEKQLRLLAIEAIHNIESLAPRNSLNFEKDKNLIVIEIDLLSDVIQRYRRAVNTVGKIDKLAKITKEDCDLITSYMTKYSKYEHSQSTETPVEIPEPCEIEKDVDALISWISEFNKR